MLMQPPPGKGRVVEEHHTCAYHREHPGESYAGCACWSAYGLVYERDIPAPELRKLDPEPGYICPPHAYGREQNAPAHRHDESCRRADAGEGGGADDGSR